MGLKMELQQLRRKMAAAAQKVYDRWEQDEEGHDEEFGTGGICDEIATAISNVIQDQAIGADIFEGGHEGDDHNWVIVQDGDEAYGVDIPPAIYEYGGGYNWTKREDVTFEPSHVVIFPVPLQAPEP
jgi:hypothetical protein